MKILVWGAGRNGLLYRKYLEEFTDDEFVGFIDNNSQLQKGGAKRPSDVVGLNFDILVVSNQYKKDREEIKKQLLNMPIVDKKIVFLVEDKELLTKVFTSINRYDEATDRRVIWLSSFAKFTDNLKIQGQVAECGVNRGEFAYYINKYFPNRKLYLFDTFEGFTEQDLEIERAIGDNAFLNSKFNEGDSFKVANIDMVKQRMPYLKQCEFHVGYFPDSAKEVNDEFCFVNLDTDLYQPILAGLEFFYPQMVENGVILIHDYFNNELPGVRKAIVDYEKKNGRLHKFPIADLCSIAIVK